MLFQNPLMQPQYHPEIIEREAQEHWERTFAFRATEEPPGKGGRPKFYCLSMFPYPSGKLHMGHVRNYTIGDVLTRYHRMRGYNVLQPMGWDAFGLPAENAAMANRVPPAKWTYDNIAYMKAQLKSLGFALDWQRELATCRPDYYHWNQWFFTRLFRKGVAYKKTGVVNWDPVDQTVLANEQVIEGRGWRTGALVEKREIPMYFLRITAYAEELLGALDALPGWPEQVKLMQKNWIGRSEGVKVGFEYEIESQKRVLWVFTTRADTLMGATFVAVAAEHPIATWAARNNKELAAFVEECKRGPAMEADLAQIDKKGMPTGVFVSHPITNEKLSAWVANYVLMGYGEGAVMAVPAHDERDYEFARKYGLPVKPVIRHPLGDAVPPPWRAEYAAYGVCINSGKYDGLDYRAAVEAIASELKKKRLGEKQVQWRLHDWGISRQRYWGCPIPIVHCAACGDVPVPDEQLPVQLPERMVLAESYYIDMPGRREWVNPYEVEVTRDPKGKILSARTKDGTEVVYDGIGTMSKSKNNGVDPQDLIDKYGADTARFFVIFASPPEQSLEWSDSGVEGASRFLRRLWLFAAGRGKAAADHASIRPFIPVKDWSSQTLAIREFRRGVHLALKQASYDYDRMQYNTVVSACMKMLNLLEDFSGGSGDVSVNAVSQAASEAMGILLRVLYPVAPHISFALWRDLGYAAQHGDLLTAPWPVVDEVALEQDEIELVLQVNGKLRGHMRAPKSAGRGELERLALANDAVTRFTNGQAVKKVVVVPGRLVNVVV